ncbi:MAG: PorV/PorQ family protein [Calditrichaeota bacterium]|nr:PorV/PorQ family protein [Calditrichota bacterium]
MKYNKYILAIVCILLIAALPLRVMSQDGKAGMPGTYLHMGVGAQALSLGKAYTALASDATAIYWNPAGLAIQNPYQVYFMHSVLFFDTNFDYLAGSLPTRSMGSFGLGILYLNSGSFDQRNELNQELGSFGISDMAFMLSWAKELFPNFSAGINYKLVTQNVLDYSGTGHGFDLGLRTRLFDRLETGVMVMNLLTPKMKLAYESETYPMQVRVGAAMPFLENKLIVSMDIAKIIGWESAILNIGTEYRAMENLSIRGGVNNGRVTLGLGFTWNQVGVDYGHKNVSEFGLNHTFAVKYAFGGFGVSATAYPEIFSPMGDQNVSHISLKAKSRSAIQQWTFEILDKKENVIRSFSERGLIPEEIVWDGRDNSGALVEDGKFKYHFEIWTVEGEHLKSGGSLVSIDTEGPAGILGLGPQD